MSERDVCPHPARNGRHEWYTRVPDGSLFCRACGFRTRRDGEPTRPVLEWQDCGGGLWRAEIAGYGLVADATFGWEVWRRETCTESGEPEPTLEATQAACERAAVRILREAVAKLEGR